MTTKQEKAILKRASSIGDSDADRVLKDINEEEGQGQNDEFRPPEKGDWAVVFTMGFHYAGRITGIDHEWIGLASGHAWINNSGSVEGFEVGNFEDWEYCRLPGVVAKGSVFYVKLLDKPLTLKKK